MKVVGSIPCELGAALIRAALISNILRLIAVVFWFALDWQPGMRPAGW